LVGKMKVKDIVLIGILSASLTAGKLALSFIPNVEIVTLLFIVFTLSLGIRRGLFIAIVFATTEILIYGFSTWVLLYYFIWPLLVVITGLLGKLIKSEYGYAILAAIFGLCFGLFAAINESIFYGLAYGLVYWTKGLVFDLVHGVSNFIIVLLLFKPLNKFISKQISSFLMEQ